MCLRPNAVGAVTTKAFLLGNTSHATFSNQRGTVQLTIKPKGKTLKQLKAHGKAKVTVTVTYTPTGGFPKVVTKKVRLVRKHG